MGVRPGPNQSSFNNIVFSYWYHVARTQQGQFNQQDLDALKKHINDNKDEHGLYAPKNSHDNITYLMLSKKSFHIGSTDDMDFWTAIKEMGVFRIWDVITYGAVFGPKYLRWFFRLFLFIPCWQMVSAIKSEGKTRPKWFEFDRPHYSRILWWFKKRELVKEDVQPTITYKTWRLKDGTERVSRHLQNDGKHLAVFRLYGLMNELPAFKKCAQKCRTLLIEKFGPDYTYEIINNYFQDRKHPVIAMWKGHGDILK